MTRESVIKHQREGVRSHHYVSSLPCSVDMRTWLPRAACVAGGVDRVFEEKRTTPDNLISCDWEVTTQNLFKEGNKVADRFARAVRLEDLGVMVHYRPRLEVVAMFQQDR
ncbi:hypothetical protein V6N13_014910 [Hibiscus sabdariffa]